MPTPVRLPELGAGPAPVTLSVWYASEGDAVYEGDRLVEVLAGNATFDVASPATGRLLRRDAWPGDVLRPGQALGEVGEESV